MNILFIVISVLLLKEVRGDCDNFKCFSDLMKDFLSVNSTDSFKGKIAENKSNSTQEDSELLKVFINAAQTIKENNKTYTIVKESDVIKHIENETKILVKVFQLNDLVKDDKNESTNKDIKPNDVTTVLPETTTNIDKATQNIDIVNTNILDNIEINVQDNEILNDYVSYFDIKDDNETDYPIIDYVEIYKDTTNEDIEYVSTAVPTVNNEELTEKIQFEDYDFTEDYKNTDAKCQGRIADVVFPWITTIFIKNGTSNQYQYYCDGALLSNSKIITAARCVFNNSTLKADDVLVFIGKRSLQAMGEDEKVLRVKSILVHENFSLEGDQAVNDLAILDLEEPPVFSKSVQEACLGEGGDVQKAVTTAWKSTGELATISFDSDKTGPCGSDANTFCATFGNDIPLCPSYGGIFASRSNSWSLQGILSGNTADRGLCAKKTVTFTNLSRYIDWIMANFNK